METKCPKCSKPVAPGVEAPTGSEGRRHARMVTCPCNTIVRFMSYEGWDRWYAVDWQSLLGDGSGKCADRDAFHERVAADKPA